MIVVICGYKILIHCWFVIYLNFANPDKVSILLNNVTPFQRATILEPAEGGRWEREVRIRGRSRIWELEIRAGDKSANLRWKQEVRNGVKS